MRRVVLGLMLIPGVLAGAYMASHGSRVAVASPVETRASARLARMLQGDFEAPASGSDDAHVGAVTRKVCRVDAPALGEHVLYAEERFANGTGRPLSQRVYVVDGQGHRQAHVREFTLLDPEGARGLCDDASKRHLTSDEVSEREGCDLVATWRGDRFEAATAGTACRSVLNGASHAKRELLVREGEVTVRDRGYDAHGEAVWGHLTAPMRFSRRAAL